jgi:SAM-dependent methyltransferase
VAFDVPADAYDSFMGRYSVQLVPQMLELAGVRAGQSALDVGCGPGALTTGLVQVLGADQVVAVDPSAPFVAANRQRNPGVEVHGASAEELPFDGGRFDVALAQLVVHFMTDPVAGLREMARVVRPGGVVAACVWDHGGGRSPIAVFWHVAHSLDPGAPDESALNGAREGHLVELFEAAGLDDIQDTVLSAALEYDDFDTWWQPFTFGVGPAGEYFVSRDERGRDGLRDGCRELLGPPPFTVSAEAWAAKGVSVG